LRLLADVGLVGLPNAGKSSLLARLTRAAPKVADYPFTTLEPVLGVLEGEERQLVVADIPGLIEGASEGAGLGVDFLAHVERTSVLVHVLDIAPELTGGAEPEANYETIERELAAHDERLAALPRVLALSKSDLVTAEHTQQAIAQWQARVGPETPVIATSSATRAGIETLAAELLHRVPTARAQEDVDEAALRAAGMGRGVEDQGVPLDPELPPAVPHDGAEEEVLAEHMVFRPAPRTGFTVERLAAGRFAVRGRGIERLLARHDTENAEAMAYVEERLRRIGVLGALEAEGYEPGDELEIGGRLLALKLRA
jgi:GTP-binding protein